MYFKKYNLIDKSILKFFSLSDLDLELKIPVPGGTG